MRVHEYLRRSKELRLHKSRVTERTYIKDPSQAPPGADVKQGDRGGYYYEEPGSGADGDGAAQGGAEPLGGAGYEPASDTGKKALQWAQDPEITADELKNLDRADLLQALYAATDEESAQKLEDAAKMAGWGDGGWTPPPNYDADYWNELPRQDSVDGGDDGAAPHDSGNKEAPKDYNAKYKTSIQYDKNSNNFELQQDGLRQPDSYDEDDVIDAVIEYHYTHNHTGDEVGSAGINDDGSLQLYSEEGDLLNTYTLQDIVAAIKTA